MTQQLFSDEPAKGWIPPSIAAPFICIFLFAISMLPFDFWMEYLGLTDANGSPRGPLGLCLLLVSFIAVGLTIFGWIALLLACFTVQASIEEFVFRGWLFSTIIRRWNTTAAFILTSATFSFLHFSPRTSLLMLVMTFVYSIFACAWVRRSNSIWGVMGWHTGWNWFGGTGFDVPITGLETGLPALVAKMVPVGPAWLTGAGEGPEGSVFTVALLTLASLSFMMLPRSREQNGS